MLKYALCTSVIFVASLLWLYVTWSFGNVTKSWDPVTAQILDNDMRETIDGSPAGWITTISYTIDDTEYETRVDEYLVGKEATVYVNPDDPSDVVGKAGTRIQDMVYPLALSVGSSLFSIVLLMIAFSPQEDD